MDDEYGTQVDNLLTEVLALSPEQKLRVLDAILTDFDKPDDKIDQKWAQESIKRRAATNLAFCKPSRMKS